jgi:hypothetical protein
MEKERFNANRWGLGRKICNCVSVPVCVNARRLVMAFCLARGSWDGAIAHKCARTLMYFYYSTI